MWRNSRASWRNNSTCSNSGEESRLRAHLIAAFMLSYRTTRKGQLPSWWKVPSSASLAAPELGFPVKASVISCWDGKVFVSATWSARQRYVVSELHSSPNDSSRCPQKAFSQILQLVWELALLCLVHRHQLRQKGHHHNDLPWLWHVVMLWKSDKTGGKKA